jgi:hypothetical protein
VVSSDREDALLKPGQIKEYCTLKSSIDSTKEKIENLLQNRKNDDNLKTLIRELNDYTVQLLNNLVRQLSEERHYSKVILTNLNDELSNVDLLIETIQNLSQQNNISNFDDRRVSFSFIVPENHTDQTMHSPRNGK